MITAIFFLGFYGLGALAADSDDNNLNMRNFSGWTEMPEEVQKEIFSHALEAVPRAKQVCKMWNKVGAEIEEGFRKIAGASASRLNLIFSKVQSSGAKVKPSTLSALYRAALAKEWEVVKQGVPDQVHRRLVLKELSKMLIEANKSIIEGIFSDNSFFNKPSPVPVEFATAMIAEMVKQKLVYSSAYNAIASIAKECTSLSVVVNEKYKEQCGKDLLMGLTESFGVLKDELNKALSSGCEEMIRFSYLAEDLEKGKPVEQES